MTPPIDVPGAVQRHITQPGAALASLGGGGGGCQAAAAEFIPTPRCPVFKSEAASRRIIPLRRLFLRLVLLPEDGGDERAPPSSGGVTIHSQLRLQRSG